MKKLLQLFAGAALLFGSCLTIAHADQLNVNAQTGTTYTFLNSDCSKLVTFSNASAVAVTLPQASSASGGGAGAGTFMPPCDIKVINKGAGTVTITPTTSTIGGNSTLALTTAQSAEITSDGTNYQATTPIGGGSLPASLTSNAVVIGQGSAPVTTAGPGTNGQVLAGVTSGAPAFTTTLIAPLYQLGSGTGTPAHLATGQTTAPALTSCGTGSPSIVGTDAMGVVTMGTSATGCIITFNVAYTGTPACLVNWIATPLASQSWVTAAATITTTQTSTSGNKLVYFCTAPSGG